MKSGWVIKKLGEVCELIGGGTPSIHESSYYGGNIPWATVRDMNCRVIEKTERTITRKGLENSASNVIPAGNVIISTHVGLGKVCFVAQDTAINQDLKGVIPLADTIQRSFLYYWFLSIAEYLEKSGTGSTVRGVKLDFVKNLEFPVPSLPEQKRIVAKIDAAFEKIDKLKANAERNLANAKELFQSALDEAMRPKKGWVEKRLGEVCSKIGSGATPKGGRNSYRADGISLIRSMNVYDHAFKYDELAHINEVQAKLLENVTIEQDDVLINITGASVARCCVVPNDVLPARVNQHVSILRIANRKVLEPDFLCYSLITKECKVRLLGIGEAGSTRQALTKSDLQSFTISMPMIIEQRQIVNRLDFLAEKVKLLEQHYTRQIADCAEMRQSVLREAFEGRL